MPPEPETLAQQSIFSTNAGDIAFAAALVALGFICKIVISTVSARIQKSTAGRRSTFDRIFIQSLVGPAGWAAVLGGTYIAIYIFPVAPGGTLDVAVALAAKLVALALTVWFGVRFVDGACDYWKDRTAATPTRLNDQATDILRKVMKVLVVIAGGAIFLQNLGFSVGSILAGLGLGGMAVALAAKDSLANLFGAVVVFWDRPFDVGDWVAVRDVEGEVEEVGFRSTRIRTLSNTLVTMPNADFAVVPVVNWSKLKRRCIDITLRLPCDTPPEKLEQALAAIRNTISESQDMHKTPIHVRLKGIGESSLEVMVVCFTVTTDYATFLSVREQLLLSIIRNLRDLSIPLAFPTHTVLLPRHP